MPTSEAEITFLSVESKPLPPEEATCPVCSEPIKGREWVRCFACEVLYHKDCYEFVGGCGTYACSGNKGPEPEVIEEADGEKFLRVGSAFAAVCFYIGKMCVPLLLYLIVIGIIWVFSPVIELFYVGSTIVSFALYYIFLH